MGEKSRTELTIVCSFGHGQVPRLNDIADRQKSRKISLLPSGLTEKANGRILVMNSENDGVDSYELRVQLGFYPGEL